MRPSDCSVGNGSTHNSSALWCSIHLVTVRRFLSTSSFCCRRITRHRSQTFYHTSKLSGNWLAATTANATNTIATRHFSWNPAAWGSSDTGRHSSTAVENDLPHIFANQPEEVDDYIRPERSVFERIEDFWDWVVSFMQPVEKQVEVMRGLRHDGILGYDLGGWGNVFFFYGICMRLLTVIPSLYGHRNALRLAQIGPQLSEITASQNKIKNDRTLSTADKRIVKEGYNRLKYALFKKHGCAQWKSFLSMMTAPITMSAFLSIRRLSTYETDLEMAPFLWVGDLTMPDPTYVLPTICAGMFILNFELNQRMQKGGRSSFSMYIRWAVRGGSVVGVYFFASQPSAMFAYWIGLSVAGLLQPTLLRWQPFRDYFGFPDPPQAARASIISNVKRRSLYEYIFSSKEERAKMNEGHKARHDALRVSRFENVNDYDLVLGKEVNDTHVANKNSKFDIGHYAYVKENKCTYEK